METVKSSTTIQSLQVGMSIIDALIEEGNPLRFSEIQERTKITKSNLYKYLNTLTQLELLYRDKNSGVYYLGSKLIQYGMAAIGQEDVITRLIPYLKEISQELDCTVLFTVWTYKGPVISKIWNSNHILNIGAQMGSLLPPSSSTGKIFRAFLDPALTAEWIGNEGEREKEISAEELNEIRENKISFAKEPLISSVSSTSIPIFNYNYELLGAVTVVGFTDLVPTHAEEEASQYLRTMSKSISINFGYPMN